MKRKKLPYYICVVLLFMSLSMYAGRPPHPRKPPHNPELPIDGGLSYLLLTGIVFGIYQIKKRKT